MSLRGRSSASESFLQGQAIHTQWESDYLNPDMDRFYDQAFADIVARANIKPSDHVLDAGCGYCLHTTRLAKSGAKITAIDFSNAALAEAEKTISKADLAGRVSLRQADLTNLPFSAGSFDHIVCWGVLMHIPELEKALSELARVLRPGGTLVISETNMRAPDIAFRERLLRGLKSVLGRRKSDVRRTERGLEVWTDDSTGGLMVRKTDMDWLRSTMKRHGMIQSARTAGQLTEAYTNLPSVALKRVIYAINGFYYRHSLPALFAASNILFFRKDQANRP
jgi:ubiquinone/menaquinone biosynthesis C-methylase UbiE